MELHITLLHLGISFVEENLTAPNNVNNSTFVVSLAVHRDDADPPGVGAVAGKLGDVGGNVACPEDQ